MYNSEQLDEQGYSIPTTTADGRNLLQRKSAEAGLSIKI